MVLNSTVQSNNSIEEDEQPQSPPLVVNTTDFNDQDLEEFVSISQEIERATRERRSQRRRCTRSNTIVATMTREELFESTNIDDGDDDRFLKAMEHETTYDTEKNRAALLNSIENLMKYFDEDVSVKDDNLLKSSPAKKLTKGKVAAAVASLRHKYNFAPSSLTKSQQSQKPEVKAHIQELKKKYDTTFEAESSTKAKTKSPKLTRKTKVKQMALLFNNKFNSMIRNSLPEPQSPDAISSGTESITSPTFTSTLKSKSPKLKTKFPKFLTKLPNPKPSPLFKKKQLQKSSSNSSLTSSPLTKRKQQLQKQPSTTCLVAENVFQQLSVKDKVLLYNRFISDMSQQNPKFSKHAEVLESNVKKEMQRGEVVVEKQNSVKHLRESFEAKLTPGKTLSKTLQRIKRSTSKLSLNATPKAKEYEDILQTDKSNCHLEHDSPDPLHVSTLTVVLKTSPESKKQPDGTRSKSQRNRKDVTLLQDVSVIEPSFKRTQSMIRSSFCVEPLAPPRKIRRTRHELLAPKMFFQNQNLEKLFYHWLKEKNGVVFDIAPVNNKNDIIEIVAKNSRDNALPPQEVEKMLEDAISQFESDQEQELAKAEDAFALIKQTMDNEKELEKSVIEIELPLDVEIPSVETKKPLTEDYDLGLTSIPKTTSEDSQMEFKLHDVSNLSMKTVRKKKLRRSMTLRKEISMPESNTDSDSDCKASNLKVQSMTLPKSKQFSNYVKKLVFQTPNTPEPVEQNSLHYSEISTLELDRCLIRQVNSPSKIKNAYTLTVMSSPSPYSESDFYDTDLPKTPLMEASRSWPSLFEAGLEDDASMWKDKSVSTEFTDLAKSKLAHDDLHKLMLDSFIDQGFETGSNENDSPLRLRRKAVHDINKPLAKWNNLENFSTPFKDNEEQQIFKARPAIVIPHNISPIPSTKSLPINPDCPKMAIIKEDSEEGHRTSDTDLFFSQDSLSNQSNYPFDVNPNVETSKFWITSGDFTASITIQHYESERLLLLSNIYAQKSLETKEMNFGIDDKKFCLDSSATSDEIIKKVPIEENYSQYWFSTGDVLIPFRGKQMTTKKIQSFFNYIRDFMEESGHLRFGIDDCEFSNIYQQTQNPFAAYNGYYWTQPVSPLKTSDLDQSDLDSEEYEQLSQNFDSAFYNSDHMIKSQQQACSRNQLSCDSLEQIFEDARHLCHSKNQTAKETLEADLTVPEILNILQNQQTKLKMLEERMLNSAIANGTEKQFEIMESPEYMRNLRSIIAAIDNIGQGNGFNACTIEQLESFMLFLSRYADLCLANCTAHIEKILDVVMSQRLIQS